MGGSSLCDSDIAYVPEEIQLNSQQLLQQNEIIKVIRGNIIKECVFCKIINGDLPGYKIYEDEHTLAFLDIGNDVDGHTIVIPKKHVTNILDCDDETLGYVMNAIKFISNHYTVHCGYSGVNLLNASGTSAQQSVSHFHLHIIPRKKDDGIDAWPDFKGGKFSLEDMHHVLKIQ